MTFPSGVFPPMLTPFSNGAVDSAKAARYAKGLLADGAHGLCVAGSAGEFIAMDVPERQQLSEAVLAAVGGSAPVIVCVAAYRTEHSVALARHAQAAGATAVMVSAPYYMGAHVDAVWRHLASVREAVSVPVMLYHVPATTNVELPWRCSANWLTPTSFTRSSSPSTTPTTPGTRRSRSATTRRSTAATTAARWNAC